MDNTIYPCLHPSRSAVETPSASSERWFVLLGLSCPCRFWGRLWSNAQTVPEMLPIRYRLSWRLLRRVLSFWTCSISRLLRCLPASWIRHRICYRLSEGEHWAVRTFRSILSV